MKRARNLLVALGLVVAAVPAAASDALVSFKVMTPEIALKLARTTMEKCRADGYQVAVTVVDRFGGIQAVIRDRFAGSHTVDTATRKARTSASFRTSTLQLAKMAQPGTQFYGLNFVTGNLLLGGGLPIEAGGTLVGGVGVSGAPGPDIDEVCAKAGIEAIQDDLEF